MVEEGVDFEGFVQGCLKVFWVVKVFSFEESFFENYYNYYYYF